MGKKQRRESIPSNFRSPMPDPRIDTAVAAKEFRKRFDELVRYFHISPNAEDFWQQLATELLLQFIPGFQIAPKYLPGRPQSSSIAQVKARAELLSEYESLQNGVLSSTAVKTLCRKLTAKQNPLGSISPRHLRRELKRAHIERGIISFFEFIKSSSTPVISARQNLVQEFLFRNHLRYFVLIAMNERNQMGFD